MTTVEERLATLETDMRYVREDLRTVVDWVEQDKRKEAVRGSIETWVGRVVWMAVGVIVPVALAVTATWIRVALDAASGAP